MKSFVPTSVLNRHDKMGYSTPNNAWISELGESVSGLLEVSNQDVINPKSRLKLNDFLFKNPSEFDNGQSFKFISFAVWRKLFEI